MSFDGNGGYTVPSGTAAVTGAIIDSVKYNDLLTDLQTALTKCLLRDGQSAALANIPMGTNKLTGLAAGTVAGDSVRFEQLTSSTIAALLNRVSLAAGTVDAITCAFSLALTAFDNAPIWWRASGANATTTPTLQRSALASKTLVKGANQALVAGDIPGAGAWMCSVYDVTLDKEILLNPAYAVSVVAVVAPTTAATQAVTDNSTKFATTEFVRNFVQCAQIVQNKTGAVATGTTAIPLDDTIPQITEGDQYLSQAITPIDASSVLEIDVVINLTSSTIGSALCAALFQDSTANALSAGFQNTSATQQPVQIVLKHFMTAGTTSATTFKVRAGHVSGTTTVNGQTGARKFGGVLFSSISIKEWLPV